MGKKQGSRKGHDNSRKGRLVEEIAARLYRSMGVHIETRVFLRPPRSPKAKPREIDILVTVAGPAGIEPLRFAIECKNETKPIQAPAIDAFFGKLSYLGIPVSSGIFVSRSRFTSGAIERARDADIRLYRLTGIRDDGLTLEIARAFQSVIYLLMRVLEYHVESQTPEFSHAFVDELGAITSVFHDWVLHAWLRGNTPTALGFHSVNIELPPTLRNYTLPEREIGDVKLRAEVRIIGIAVTISGQLRKHLLLEQPANNLERLELDASWNESRDPISITSLASQEDLAAHKASLTGFRIIAEEVRLPRIEVGNDSIGMFYWPPSENGLRLMLEREALEKSDIRENIEGTDFGVIFDEPIDVYDRVKDITISGNRGSKAFED